MIPLHRRVWRRWKMAAAYAATAARWIDRPALFRAGLARLRPFADNSFYARFGRLFGANIAPRLHGAGGARVHLDLTDATDLMIVEEIFIDEVYPLASVPFTPATIIDCGACAGLFTLLAHARYPAAQLHLFEPEPGNLGRLRRNLTTNQTPATIHAAAVGIADGHAFFTGKGFHGHLAASSTNQAVKIEVIDFVSFVRKTASGPLLLKIDIEGAEAELLPRLVPVLPPHTALFLETHHDEPMWRGYLQPLLSAGFRHTLIRRRPESAEIEYVEHFLVRTS